MITDKKNSSLVFLHFRITFVFRSPVTVLSAVCSTDNRRNPSNGSRNVELVRQTLCGEADLRAGGGGDAATHRERARVRHGARAGDDEGEEIKPELKL